MPLFIAAHQGISFLMLLSFLHLRRAQLLSTINVAIPILFITLIQCSSASLTPPIPCNMTTAGTFLSSALSGKFNVPHIFISLPGFFSNKKSLMVNVGKD